MKFSIFKRDDSFSDELGEEIIHQILEKSDWQLDYDFPDFVICIGGDGTLLRAIHKYIDQLDHIDFVAVHTGTLGFFTDYTANEVDDFLHDLLNKTYPIKTSNLLEIKTDDHEKPLYALNEVRIGSFSKTISLDVYIDGEFFEHTTGSGICISTQAGSTAANRSLMGAVVDDGIEVLQLCEIMPVSHYNHQTLKNPYIMKSNRIVTIKGESIKDSECIFDYLVLNTLKTSSIMIKTSDKKVRFARLKPYSYLKRLKNLY